MNIKSIAIVFVIFVAAAIPAASQTSSFIYQGKLQDAGIAANGTYQFEFRLFDSASAGAQVGQTITGLAATVTNGIFAVDLDFGAAAFDGSARFLEIGVRLNGSGLPYTPLTPRQPVSSTPYAVRSLSANQANIAIDSANLGGIPAAEYVVTTDPRMSDDRNPLPDSPNYIQNTQNPQAASNFNISGTGRSNIFDATTQYNLGGSRVLSAGGNENLFAGFDSGAVTTGGFNAFFGSRTGKLNTTGASNSFFGSYAGSSNSTGNSNSFFGVNSGGSNTDGSSNAFFGGASGFSNTSGTNNSYFGVSSGQGNVLASNNAMFGFSAGKTNTGGGNSFFGSFSGEKNTTGTFNSYFGLRSGKDTFSGNYNVYLGYETGAGNQTGSNNTFVGSATSGLGSNNTLVGYQVNGGNGTGNTVLGFSASVTNGINNSVAIGTGAVADESNAIVLGNLSAKVKVPGNGIWSFGSITTPSTVQGSVLKGNSLVVTSGASIAGGIVTGDISGSSGDFSGNLTAYYLGVSHINVGGNVALCIQAPNGSNPRFLSECSSSRRYKDNIETFTGGLEIVRRLRPVTFNWKSGGMRDIGFVAEEVNEVEPLFNNFNSGGEIEGVKYGQVTTVLVNAVNEQQDEIERLRGLLKRQQDQIDALKALICGANKTAPVCSQQGGEK